MRFEIVDAQIIRINDFQLWSCIKLVRKSEKNVK